MIPISKYRHSGLLTTPLQRADPPRLKEPGPKVLPTVRESGCHLYLQGPRLRGTHPHLFLTGSFVFLCLLLRFLRGYIH
ncbi:hypothetical protein L207DRAFT_244898 [Hyaloscypha variabilis F]|jgi:hypothetical protein|uniref:Uncharacterized protein n=1 Tax=Hyaloscypha variabilis (strain UAMH 11265 / GT02V1 / F) TaxID=1149755 RepID=A0A2J6S2P2_HYAVF|nr:hypothetical protein L207DRAFT_244898 [Hyaloscypha variabilis F]